MPVCEVRLRPAGLYESPSRWSLAARVERGFPHPGAWLDARPPGAFDPWCGQGRKADTFIGGRPANGQFELVLPASFTLACGRANLPVRIRTNDWGRRSRRYESPSRQRHQT